MKRTVILVRHAKSSRGNPNLPDTERPLDDRGKRDASMMAKRLAKQLVKPDLILSSPAQRALATAEIIANRLSFSTKSIVVDGRLYATDPQTLLAVIGGLNDKMKCVMLFGHNPEFSELAHQLFTDITALPTCAVVQFTFDTKSWANIGEAKPDHVVLDYPEKA